MSFDGIELIAVSTSLAAMAASVVANYIPLKKEIVDVLDLISEEGRTELEIKKIEIENESRILDIRNELARQEFKSTWTGRSAAALRFSQYIIGGLLASSFIQDSVDPKYVGSLGVIVLVSSLINQHFKPDVRYRGSKQRTIQLRALLRHSEDHLYAIEHEIEGAGTVFEIRKEATIGLNQVEEMELLDFGADNAIEENN